MAAAIINLARLREVLFYDPTSPSGLRWKVDHSHKAKVGDVAGCRWRGKGEDWYWIVFLCGGRVYSHRAAWMLMNGQIPAGYLIDHIDGNTENNDIDNLRCVSIALNSRNQRRMNRNKTGILGVSYDRFHDQYVASWHEVDGRLRQSRFQVHKHGKHEAMRLAKICRDENMKRVQQDGAGYTIAHLSR